MENTDPALDIQVRTAILSPPGAGMGAIASDCARGLRSPMPKAVRDHLANPLHVIVRERTVERQAQHLRAGGLRHGKSPGLCAGQRPIAWVVARQRMKIGARVNVEFAQRGVERVAAEAGRVFVDANDVILQRPTGVRRRTQNLDAGKALEPGIVDRRDRPRAGRARRRCMPAPRVPRLPTIRSSCR